MEVARPLSPEEVSVETNSLALAGQPKDQSNPGSHLEPQNLPGPVDHPSIGKESDSEIFGDYEKVLRSEAENKWHQWYCRRRGSDDSFELELEDAPVPGWPQFASHLANKPFYASFSRFGELNVKSLLYYQTQLGILQRELRVLEHDDRHGWGYSPDSTEDESKRTYAMQFAERSDILMHEKESKQHELIVKIRLLLKEYSELSDVHCFGGPL